MNSAALKACDKCGDIVPRHNDVIEFELRLGGLDPREARFCRSRHLLPTGTCEGSPSRAQYIVGQPRDTRGFGYDPECEGIVREIYAAMQAGR
jgi:hypothetical protein